MSRYFAHFIPEAAGGGSVSPAAVALVLDSVAPSRIDQEVSPGAIALVLDAPTPSIVQLIDPGAIALGIGIVAPDRLDHEATPAAVALVLDAPAPSIPQIIDAGAIALALGIVAPDRMDQETAPAAVMLALGLPAPSFILSVEPGAIGLSLGSPAPSVVYIVDPDALALSLGMGSPTFSIAAIAGPRAPVIEYVVEIYSSGGTFGPGTRLGEIWDARNVGWSRYDRMPGKGFLTLSQRSPYLSLITPLTTHIKVWRLSPTVDRNVYSGVIVDPDSASDDVVFTAYDYIALLSLSRAGFKTLYPTKALGTEIASPEWLLARNAASSILGFVTTGTIQDPLATDGVTAIRSNAQFGTLMQHRLQLMYDLSEMGRANTTNHVTFEITHTAPHTFNFWKNKGVDSGAALVLNGNVRSYRYLPNWSAYRNDIATVGVGSAGGAAEIVKTNAAAIAARGLRQDVFAIRTLLGISGAATEADQQQAVTQQELTRRVQLQPTLQLELLRGGYDVGSVPIADKVEVEIGNGGDSISGLWRVIGERAIFDEGGEDAALIVGPVTV